MLVVFAQAAWCPQEAVAQTSTPTLWSFLGIKSDEESTNPAIKAAAKAKAAKHKICKKKAAIKYLAGLGCSAEHPEVAPALIAAMSDPDEPVRYEAVKAVYQTAGMCQSRKQAKALSKGISFSEQCGDLKKKVEKEFCDTLDRLCGKAPPKVHKHKLKDHFKKMIGQEECEEPWKQDCPKGLGPGPCCSDDMRAKLLKVAYGRDDKGCFVESSVRVRDMAERALKACAACNGGCEGCGQNCTEEGFGDGFDVVREMAPEDPREMRPTESLDGCQDRVVVPLPQSWQDRPVMPSPESIPTPTPATSESPTPALEFIPPPAPEPAPLKSVLVPSPQERRDRAPAMTPRPVGPGMATARQPQPGEPLWRCAEPRAFLADNACTDDAFLPYFERAGLVESARSMAGTSVLASNWFAPLDKTGVRMRSWASNPANLR
jgi:hypothetical protein